MYENLKNIGFTTQNIEDIIKTTSYFLYKLDIYRSTSNDKKYEEIKVAIPNYVIKMLSILAELGSENLKLKKK